MSTMRWVTLVLVVALAACAQKEQELFVVLPNPDGTSGAITVSDGGSSVVLDRPYAAEAVKGDKVEQTTSDSAQVQQVFGSALAAQPILPEHFRLYFLRDKDVMTVESQQQYKNVFADIKRRPVYQVEVIGYTDTLGQQPYNQELSLKRAAALRDELVRDGLNPDSITIAGRGELDPAVPTGPQVNEPRNRRVEITVR
ncbi:MAG: OmpA family protein [Deltaproteobacteria bacterium]|jgi:outer membrane protein OmpA-like peptidoglycan-associated protein|nr:OmpA family protein [Deltaproteobacteria bacterium]